MGSRAEERQRHSTVGAAYPPSSTHSLNQAFFSGLSSFGKTPCFESSLTEKSCQEPSSLTSCARGAFVPATNLMSQLPPTVTAAGFLVPSSCSGH